MVNERPAVALVSFFWVSARPLSNKYAPSLHKYVFYSHQNRKNIIIKEKKYTHLLLVLESNKSEVRILIDDSKWEITYESCYAYFIERQFFKILYIVTNRLATTHFRRVLFLLGIYPWITKSCQERKS